MNTVICSIHVQLQVLRNEQVHKNVSYNDNFHLLSYSKIYFYILHSQMWQSLKEYILVDLKRLLAPDRQEPSRLKE